MRQFVRRVDAQARGWVSNLANGLPGYFEGLHIGRPDQPRTPLFKGRAEGEILDAWKRILGQLKDGSDSDVRLFTREMEREKTFGPRGGYPPLSERLEELNKYATAFVRANKTDGRLAFEKTATLMYGKSGPLDKRPLSIRSVLDRLRGEDKLDTNSGLPDFSRRTRPEVQENAEDLAVSGVPDDLPYVLGERTQRPEKTRFIFLSPFAVNLVEGTYERVLMDTIRGQRRPQLAAWEGFDKVEDAFHDMGYLTRAGYVSTDFTTMDQHMGPDQLWMATRVSSRVFQDSYASGYVDSVMRVTRAPVLLDSAKVWWPEVHGLLSGCGYTNQKETELNCLVHESLMHDAYSALGDDGTFATDFPLRDAVNEFVALCSDIGLVTNPVKQLQSTTNFTYLQRWFDRDYLLNGFGRRMYGSVPGVYPTIQALGACVYPERFHDPDKWCAEMESMRWIMILENTNRHPLFPEFVKFVQSGDKLQLLAGLRESELESTYRQAKAISGLAPSYTQTHRDRSILDFDVMKVLHDNVSEVKT